MNMIILEFSKIYNEQEFKIGKIVKSVDVAV